MLGRASVPDAEVRAKVLDAFPVGTQMEVLLREFPARFVAFDMTRDERNGITFGGMKAGMIGKSSVTVTIDKVFWPMGLFPAVYYRYLVFGMDEDQKLLDVVVREEIDAP